MRQDERELVRQRFHYRCGYCNVRELDAGAELTIDHFQPRSKGGADQTDNWIYSCHACNEFKGDYWASDSPCRILHPLNDSFAEHISEEADGILRAITETGTFHIQRLHLNRAPLVAYRRERRLVQESLRGQVEILGRLEDLESQIRLIVAELARIEGADSNG
jgi:hypothetical protein